MQAKSTILDSQVLKATGKSWQEWADILEHSPQDAARFLRQNHQLDFWWSQAVAAAFHHPVKHVVRHNSHSSFVKLYKACHPAYLIPLPKPDRKNVTQLTPREKLED